MGRSGPRQSGSETGAALLGAALREAGTLIARSLRLAQAEIDGNIRAILGLAALFGTVALLLVATFFVWLDAAVKALAALIGNEALAALIVASPFVLVSLALGTLGLRRIARATAMPRRRPGIGPALVPAR